MSSRLATSAWRIGPSRHVSLDRPRLIGILNVTPDSFSDGGQFLDPAAAVDQAQRMIAEGADIIDIGGESTRPGAQRVDADEQIARVIPVIKRLRDVSNVVVSIDTTCYEVACAAIDAGASIINDVAAGTEDDRVLSLAAARQCGLILMHRLKPPDRDSYSHQYAIAPTYENVAADVRSFLVERAEAAIATGVHRSAIVIDPGLGFGKSVDQNYELIRRFDELGEAGYPVLCAASRKSFIGAAGGEHVPNRRVAGSVAVAVAAFVQGVRLFRAHDVAPHREALAVAARIMP
ncbi:MAG TPA: dihydropteroate synthase [Phycisphaerales bacterium]|nr:dihydropteroate synthase [Phycisphaerales bacterium]HRQ74783.1 dihydropteroate synthase [Phycisphaerales bacterium]